MARIDYVSEEELSEMQDDILDRIRDVYGFVPNQHLLEAHLPLTLESLLDLNRRVIHEGPLGAEYLEKLGLILSAESDCEYCIGYHQASYAELLKEKGMPAEEVAQLRLDWREADLSEDEKALTELAVAAREDPASVEDGDLEELKRIGVGEEALVQLIVFVNLIVGYNRFNLVFDTDPDDEFANWMGLADDDL